MEDAVDARRMLLASDSSRVGVERRVLAADEVARRRGTTWDGAEPSVPTERMEEEERVRFSAGDDEEADDARRSGSAGLVLLPFPEAEEGRRSLLPSPLPPTSGELLLIDAADLLRSMI